jgi:hypothetical protein
MFFTCTNFYRQGPEFRQVSGPFLLELWRCAGEFSEVKRRFKQLREDA